MPDGHSAGDSETHARPAGVLSSAAGRLLLAACLLEVVLIVALLFVISGLNDSLKNAQAFPRIAPATKRFEPHFRGNPGPWGELEYVRITIEPPDAFVPAEERSFAKTQWIFGKHTREQLAAFFKSCDLTPAQSAELGKTDSWADTTNGIVVTPSDKLIVELSQLARAQIYSLLADTAQNYFQCWPYTYRQDGLQEWFASSGLSDATLALTKRLMYVRGATLCFSDLPQVFAQIPTLPERRVLIKTLSRNSTLLMKLRVRPDTDVRALTAYWAKGGRAKDIEPLLESLTKVPGSITVDVAHLLPPFARKRLNAYPEPSADPGARLPDCYWTALNFFNDPPDDRYYDDAVWSAELHRDFEQVSAPQYGDLIFILKPDGTPVHAAVHIADDVVFTKNGGNFRQPWILMKWEDAKARYPENSALHTAVFRRKAALK